jgi:hypothetical protein
VLVVKRIPEKIGIPAAQHAQFLLLAFSWRHPRSPVTVLVDGDSHHLLFGVSYPVIDHALKLQTGPQNPEQMGVTAE